MCSHIKIILPRHEAAYCHLQSILLLYFGSSFVPSYSYHYYHSWSSWDSRGLRKRCAHLFASLQFVRRVLALLKSSHHHHQHHHHNHLLWRCCPFNLHTIIFYTQVTNFLSLACTIIIAFLSFFEDIKMIEWFVSLVSTYRKNWHKKPAIFPKNTKTISA